MAFRFFPSLSAAFLHLTDLRGWKRNYRCGSPAGRVFLSHLEEFISFPSLRRKAYPGLLALLYELAFLSLDSGRERGKLPCSTAELATRWRNPALGSARTFPIVVGSFRPLVELRAASTSSSSASAVSALGSQPLSRQRAAALRPSQGECGPRPRAQEQRVWGPGAGEEGDDEAGPGRGSGGRGGSRCRAVPGAWSLGPGGRQRRSARDPLRAPSRIIFVQRSCLGRAPELVAGQAEAWGCGAGVRTVSARQGPPPAQTGLTEGRVAVRGPGELTRWRGGGSGGARGNTGPGRESENHLFCAVSPAARGTARMVQTRDGVPSCPWDAAMTLHCRGPGGCGGGGGEAFRGGP